MIAIDVTLKFVLSMVAAIILIYIFNSIRTSIINYFSNFKTSKANYEISVLEINKIDEKWIKVFSEVCIDVLNYTNRAACFYLKSNSTFQLDKNFFEGEYNGKKYEFYAIMFDPSKNNGLIIGIYDKNDDRYIIYLIN